MKILKKIYLILNIFLFIIIDINVSFSQCDTCPLPRHPQTKTLPVDGIVDVILKDHKPPVYGVSSIKRVTIKNYGKYIQGIKVTRINNGNCQDTILSINDVSTIYSSNLGIGGATLNIPVLPGREYFYDETQSILKLNIISLSSNLFFMGKDKSTRNIGTDQIAYGINFALYPFKDILGKRIKTGLGSGLLVENGRARIPLYGSIRYNFWGTEYEEEYFNFYPSPCKFGIEGETPISPQNKNLIEVPTTEKVDSTVYFFLDRKIIKDEFRPYLFLNGGTLFDTGFEGSGSNTALNKDDYGQFFVQFGVGMPLFEIIDISVGISYYRFNLRTPCDACSNYFIINTNNTISTFINFGIFLSY